MNNDVQKWKVREVLGLVKRYSPVHLIKFFALECLAFMSTIVLSIDYHGLLVTVLTFISSLLFDQITKNKLDDDFDYKKIGNLCNMGIVYISVIFIVVLCFFVVEELIEENVPLIVCKIVLFIITFMASFSALIEGISNLPPQALPSQQEKVNE